MKHIGFKHQMENKQNRYKEYSSSKTCKQTCSERLFIYSKCLLFYYDSYTTVLQLIN